ncbi:hypothetical protein DL764_000888 [Monosporascus ibericus]|uniref:Alpha-L-rhamnosidase C-terminal domain-containing protein n=1 Tax=Monosporascus ibericus TaxID=155417 RepID=A0A4Q4TV76_9PEZI|nr:hypothetical protein DL764_000888 [Monosporascus ibericus]
MSYTTESCTDLFRVNDTEPPRGFSESSLEKLRIHDGPKRDRDPYMGDLPVSALASYLAHNVQEAPRNVVEDLAQHQRSDSWIPPAIVTMGLNSWRTPYGVTPLLSTYVLGVKPLRPVSKEWIVKPVPEDVQWAREDPNPYGPLKVSWERSGAGGDMEVHAHALEGTDGTVSVPAARNDAEGRRALVEWDTRYR